jgi:hypothetical protein
VRALQSPAEEVMKLFALVVLFLLPTLAYATEVPTSTAPSYESLLVMLIATCGAAAVSLVTAGVKKLLPSIPRAAVPILVAGLGVTAEWGTSYATGGHFSPIVAALLSTGAIYLHEIFTTVRDHGIAKPSDKP